jgi:DNA-binding FadR family transcriptional regulator
MDNVKASEAVARALQREIVAKRLPTGSNLGSAAELEKRFGVSKPVLREAVRILESRLLSIMRPGPGGGLIVSAPTESLATEGATLYLEYQRVSLPELHVVRRSLELSAIALTVANLDEDGITRLRQAVAEERVEGAGEVSTTAFHLLLAELSGNKALSLFVHVVIRIMNDRFENRGRRDLSQADLDALHARHQGICDAVVSSDVGLAQHRMLRHLEELELAVSRQAEDKHPDSDESRRIA